MGDVVKAEIVKSEEIENTKKIKGILHWVSSEESVDCETREFDRLFNKPFPGKTTGNFMDDIVRDSKKIYKKSKISKKMIDLLKDKKRWQFERKGFYYLDKDSNLE